MRLVSLVGSRHHDHDRDPNGGSGRGGDNDDDDNDNDDDSTIALATGPSTGSGLVCDANEATTSAGWMRTHNGGLAIACEQFCVHCRYAAGTVGAGGWRGAKARDENCAGLGGWAYQRQRLKDTEDGGGEEKQVESKHQNAREAEKKTDGDESRGGGDVCEKKGGWGKRAKSADDVLPSEPAKFTALGSDAQRRSWGREGRGWRHDLLDRADTSFGDRYKDGGRPWLSTAATPSARPQIGCDAIARPRKAGINDLLCVNC
ncbi:hypothetical protein BM1_04049 [Bipolaris maydis]|nr:hypothetical protein BM1_04049 [Bipolaris maydis]